MTVAFIRPYFRTNLPPVSYQSYNTRDFSLQEFIQGHLLPPLLGISTRCWTTTAKQVGAIDSESSRIDPRCANNWKGEREIATKSLIRDQFDTPVMAGSKTTTVTYISLYQRLLLQIQSHPLDHKRFIEPSLSFYTSPIYHSSSKKESQIPCSYLPVPLPFLSMNCQLSI